MSSDPYGFPESPTGTGSPADAILSLWTGVAALVCGAIGPCLCYMPWFLALPLSGAALWYGIRARSAPGVRSQGLDAAANAGLVSGGVGLFFSLLYVALFFFYVLYMVVVFGAIFAGEL